jgi:hypothetical protein
MLAAKTIAFNLATQDNLRLSMAADQTVAVKLRLRANANALDRSAERNHAALETCQANRAAIPDEAELADLMRDAKGMIAETSAQIAAAKAVMTNGPRPASASAQAAAPAPAGPAKPATPPAALAAVVPAPSKPAAPAAVVPAQAKPAALAAPKQDLQPPRMADPRDKLAWADAMTVVAEEMTAGISALPPAYRKQELMRARLLSSAASDVTLLATGALPQYRTVTAAKK